MDTKQVQNILQSDAANDINTQAILRELELHQQQQQQQAVAVHAQQVQQPQPPQSLPQSLQQQHQTIATLTPHNTSTQLHYDANVHQMQQMMNASYRGSDYYQPMTAEVIVIL